MSFAHPGLVAAALAAAALFGALHAFAEAQRRGSVFSYSSVPVLIAAAQPRAWPARVAAAALIAAVLLIGLAFAGPRVRAAVPVQGGTVVLCIDTSGSMAAGDVQPTRADAARAALRAFIDAMPSQTAVGIVSFAKDAQEIAPPTRDRDQLQAALEAIPTPNGATAIGDALSLARRVMPSSGHRVVVLITDGENNTGSDPLRESQLLASHGITLFTVGIGTNTGAMVPGTLEQAGIDEEALRTYAGAAGGAYSRADDAAQLRQSLVQLGRTTSFTRGILDLSLDAAAAGALLMIVTVLWTKLI